MNIHEVKVFVVERQANEATMFLTENVSNVPNYIYVNLMILLEKYYQETQTEQQIIENTTLIHEFLEKNKESIDPLFLIKIKKLIPKQVIDCKSEFCSKRFVGMMCALCSIATVIVVCVVFIK